MNFGGGDELFSSDPGCKLLREASDGKIKVSAFIVEPDERRHDLLEKQKNERLKNLVSINEDIDAVTKADVLSINLVRKYATPETIEDILM